MINNAVNFNLKEGYLKLLILVPVIIYCWLVFNHIDNIPKAADDLNYYLTKYYYTIEINPKFADVIRYLFFADDPHQKIDSKLMSLLSKFLIGDVNFKFILIVGHLFFLSTIWLLSRIYDRISFMFILAAAFFLFNVSWPTAQWAVAIWGYHSFLVLATALALSLLRGHQKSAIGLFIFSLFTIGSGFTVGIIAIVYYLLAFINSRSITDKKRLGLWIILFIAGFAFTLLRYNPESAGVEINAVKILHLFNFGIGFMFDCIKINAYPTQSLVLFYFITAAITVYSLKNIKNLSRTQSLAAGILLMVLANGFISGYSRNYIDNFIPSVPLRYEIYSFYSVAICILFIGTILENRTKLTSFVAGILCLSLSFYTYLSDWDRDTAQLENSQRLIRLKLKNALASNPIPKTYVIDDYISAGIYNINTIAGLEAFNTATEMLADSSSIEIGHIRHQLVSYNQGRFAVQAIGFMDELDIKKDTFRVIYTIEDTVSASGIEKWHFEALQRPLNLTPNFRYFKKDYEINRKKSAGYELFILKQKLALEAQGYRQYLDIFINGKLKEHIELSPLIIEKGNG